MLGRYPDPLANMGGEKVENLATVLTRVFKGGRGSKEQKARKLGAKGFVCFSYDHVLGRTSRERSSARRQDEHQINLLILPVVCQ